MEHIVEISIKHARPEKISAACLIVGVHEDCKLTPEAARLDKASGGQIKDILNRGDHKGKPGNALLLHAVRGIAAERVLLVGLGPQAKEDSLALRKAVAAAARNLADYGVREAAFCLPWGKPSRSGGLRRLRDAVVSLRDSLYRFDRLKSRPEEGRSDLQRVLLGLAPDADTDAAEQALNHGMAIAAGMDLARDLGNLPGNLCTPTYLAEQATQLARDHGIGCEVLDRDAMAELGMHSLLSVAKGSHQPPRFIIMRHRGNGKKPPLVLVGKGITFDSGGISLKPGAGMDEMKYDMCGAASVFGIMKMAAMLDLPINLVGLVPATENMPGGSASKPGDVVTSMSGQTIEILNTDAEGRLILCDALTYAERFDPAAVVDIATLTGACVTALGHVATGLFANDDDLAGELLEAGTRSHDRAWRMPLWDDYQEQLKSNFADMANIGGPPAGSITAACFLSRFAKKFRWAHLDIAGTAWRSGKDKGATGRPVPLLAEFLLERSRRRPR